MSQSVRTLQETTTSLSPAEVLTAAKSFFTRRNSVYAAFIDMEGPTFVTLRGQGGEEIAIGVSAATPEYSNGTRVTGSTYLFDQQLARFLSTLPTAALAQNATGNAGAPMITETAESLA